MADEASFFGLVGRKALIIGGGPSWGPAPADLPNVSQSDGSGSAMSAQGMGEAEFVPVRVG
jgi:hypothetical protein